LPATPWDVIHLSREKGSIGVSMCARPYHERGLARTVGADDPHARAHVDAQIEVIQREALQLGVPEAAVGEADERRAQVRRLREVELHLVPRPGVTGVSPMLSGILSDSSISSGIAIGKAVAVLAWGSRGVEETVSMMPGCA